VRDRTPGMALKVDGVEAGNLQIETAALASSVDYQVNCMSLGSS
jgi:hypothetical protein